MSVTASAGSHCTSATATPNGTSSGYPCYRLECSGESGYGLKGWYYNSSSVASGPDVIYVDRTPSVSKELVAEYSKAMYLWYRSDGVNKGNTKIWDGESTVVKSISKDNYELAGWSETNGGTTVDYEVGDTYTASVTTHLESKYLYAIWKAVYNVSFDANGGTGSMYSQQFTSGVVEALDSCTLTRSGYRFVEWNTQADGSGDSYADGADGSGFDCVGGATVTLYAQWEFVGTSITITNSNTNAGAIRMYYSDDGGASWNVLVPEAGGVVSYTSDVVTDGRTYKVEPILTYPLYSAKGVLVSGQYQNPYVFSVSAGVPVVGTFVFEEKTRYSVTLELQDENGNVVSDRGTASVTSPSTPDKTEGGVAYYVEGRSIGVTVSPAAGCEVLAWVAKYWDSSRQSWVSSASGGAGNSLLLESDSFTHDTTIVIKLKKSQYSLSISADSASTSAISSTSIKKDGVSVSTCEYGDTIAFSAVVASGFSIGGFSAGEEFYTIDDEEVSVSGNVATLTLDIVESISVSVKAAVSVSMSAVYPNGTAAADKSCSIAASVNGVAVQFPASVVLGDTLVYTVTLGKQSGGVNDWVFDAWYTDASCTPANITQNTMSGTISPTANLSLYCNFLTAAVTNKLTVYTINKNQFVKVSADANRYHLDSATGTVSGDAVEFSVVGTRMVTLTAEAGITTSGSTKAFSCVANSWVSGAPPPPSSIVSENVNTQILLNSSKTLYVYYGEAAIVNTTIAYGKGDRSKGDIRIVGKSDTSAGSSIAVDGMSALATQGTTLVLSATAMNGYKFVGWYSTAECVGAPDVSSSINPTISVTSARTVYARFDTDTHAIFEWEGSSNNKMLTWKSKVMVSDRPFNPSCLRVDSLKYVVDKVSVGMFSAPDAAPTAVTDLENVASQTVRRLPIRRMERYVQVTVRNDAEVDAIFVGTSARGIAV